MKPAAAQSWDSTLYDSKHAFISRYGDSLLELLKPKKGERILDVGCGTGDLAQKIAETGATVVGIDASPEMITQARQKYTTLSFTVMDARHLTVPDLFDAIFSNAALHWIKEAAQAIQSMNAALKPGGRLVIEMGGHGNVETIIHAIANARVAQGYSQGNELNPWYFPSIAEYTTLLETNGFAVQLAHLFDRPTPLEGKEGLRNWLTMFAEGTFLSDIPEKEKSKLLEAIEKRCSASLYKNDTWIADYRRLRIIATKEK